MEQIAGDPASDFIQGVVGKQRRFRRWSSPENPCLSTTITCSSAKWGGASYFTLFSSYATYLGSVCFTLLFG